MEPLVDSVDARGSPEKYRERTTYLARDYQAFSLEHQINLAPVDDDEESRLREQHVMLRRIFDDRKDPLLPDLIDDPQDVLDCGYGTGDWAYELAETFSDCNVLGVDISPVMELGDMPDNLNQECKTLRSPVDIFDLNDTFTFQASSFDFVHSRFVAGGIAHNRWPGYLTDIKRILRSRAWVQLTEWEFVFRSNNGNTDRLQSLQRWSEIYLTAVSSGTGKGRKSRTVPDGLETMLRMSGFSNVTTDVREIPTCGWPSAPSRRDIGLLNKDNMEALIRGIALYPVTSRGILSEAEFYALVDEAALELGDEQAQPYLRLYTLYGQKP